jgi:hypothetical protein
MILVVTLFLPAVVFGKDLMFHLGGYGKNLLIRSNSFFTDEPYLLNIDRLRIEGIMSIGNLSHSEIWLDTEALLGSYLDTPDFALSQSFERTTFFDLNWNLIEKESILLRQNIFRVFTSFQTDNIQVTLGRQRIAWGTGFVWNPTDLLNPVIPVSIERDEKEGVDAAYLAIPLSALSRGEVAFAPGKNEGESSGAIRLSTNFLTYDISIIGGEFREDLVVGSDFAGYIKGAGFRGEFSYTWKEGEGNFFRGILNGDYNLPHGIYVILELYFNGEGTTNKNEYDNESILSGESLSLAKHYLAGYMSTNITPLLGIGLYSIVNLDDGSSLIGPSMNYSIIENLDFSLSTYFFTGSDDSELGSQGNYYFAFLQYYY